MSSLTAAMSSHSSSRRSGAPLIESAIARPYDRPRVLHDGGNRVRVRHLHTSDGAPVRFTEHDVNRVRIRQAVERLGAGRLVPRFGRRRFASLANRSRIAHGSIVTCSRRCASRVRGRRRRQPARPPQREDDAPSPSATARLSTRCRHRRVERSLRRASRPYHDIAQQWRVDSLSEIRHDECHRHHSSTPRSTIKSC